MSPPKACSWRTLNVLALSGLVIIHLLAVLVCLPMFFSWSGVCLCIMLCLITGPLGVTLCFHRLLTHGSFKTARWFKYLLTVCATLSWQGGVLRWVGTHRIHHLHSDEEGDPHSPTHGFTWAHMLWTLFDNLTDEEIDAVTRDLRRNDPFIVFIDTWYWAPQIILTLALFALGYFFWDWKVGVSWVVWGVGLRTTLVYHSTWFVNSASHTWGYQTYKTGDGSKNLWWVAAISFGEGWHNNHHAHPTSARHGERWWELDVTYLIIRALSLIGLAREINHKTAIG